MARWAPERDAVLSEYAEEVLAVFPRGRILVGVDGVNGSGRTTFARDLAAALQARDVTAAACSLDDFHTAESGWADADARTYYAAAYDYAAFRRLVVEPYRRGDRIPLAHRPSGNGTILDPPVFAPAERAVLVVEGPFLHRPELVGLWHTSALLQVPRADARQRAAERDGIPVDDPHLEREFQAVELYYRAVDARKLANASFDMTDPAHPRRIFADAC